MKLAKRGGAPIKLADTTGDARLAMDSAALYLSQLDGGIVTRVPKDGGAAKILAKDVEQLGSIAADDESIYWVGGGKVEILPEKRAPAEPGAQRLEIPRATINVVEGESVWRLAKRGGKPTAIVKGLAFANRLRVDRDAVYWSTMFEPGIYRAPKRGGPAVRLVSDRRGILDWILDGSNLYWVSGALGAKAFEIKRVSTTGGAPLALWSGDKAVLALATDATHLYFMAAGQYGDAEIVRVPKAGGVPKIIGRGGAELAIDEASIYWITASWISRIPKPSN
jgi:hypothetical protein